MKTGSALGTGLFSDVIEVGTLRAVFAEVAELINLGFKFISDDVVKSM